MKKRNWSSKPPRKWIRRNTAVLYLLAVAEKQLDQPARSAELLERVIALEPGNADAQFLLGQVLAKLGREADAIGAGKRRSS